MTGTYQVNGHEFAVVEEYPRQGAQIVECTECLVRDRVDDDEDPQESLELMNDTCHIEWLRKPDGSFRGFALRNVGHFEGRQLIGVKEEDGDFEVVDKIRVYDDDAPLLTSLLDRSAWNNRERQAGSKQGESSA